MPRFCALILLCLVNLAQAAEWRNDAYGVVANLPDTAGWQPIEAPSSAAITVLAAMQQPQKQAVFGINVLHQLPNANLRDPGTLAMIEKSLRDLGYQFFGRASVNVGGREWLQFPVRGGNPPSSGLIRYTSANNQVYVVSLLRGGGQEAAQDPELLTAAASVRINQPQATVAATAPSAPTVAQAPAPGTSAPPSAASSTTPAASEPAETAVPTGMVKIGPIELTQQQVRLGLFGAVGLLVLVILMKIIGGGGDRDRKR